MCTVPTTGRRRTGGSVVFHLTCTAWPVFFTLTPLPFPKLSNLAVRCLKDVWTPVFNRKCQPHSDTIVTIMTTITGGSFKGDLWQTGPSDQSTRTPKRIKCKDALLRLYECSLHTLTCCVDVDWWLLFSLAVRKPLSPIRARLLVIELSPTLHTIGFVLNSVTSQRHQNMSVCYH